MKMHEKLQVGASEPRNRTACKMQVSYNEESGEPVQIWLRSSDKKQGIFLTEQEAKALYYRLGYILSEKE